MSVVEPELAHSEVSPEQQELIAETLRAILGSPYFSKSKRYPAFLEFAVRSALEEHSGALKERTVGVEVFGRSPDYDTSSDPVVRIAAGEVRRRMALYFSGHPEAPVRIDLPVGSYKAEFHFRASPPATEDAAPMDEVHAASTIAETPHGEPAAGAREASRMTGRWRTGRGLVVLAAVLLIAAVTAGAWRYLQVRDQRQFWRPVLAGDQAALILVGNSGPAASQGVAASQPRSSDAGSAAHPNLVLNDAVVAAQVCGVFRQYGRDCDIESAPQEKVEDIRGKAVVAVGGLNNQWTNRLLAPLEYQIGTDLATKRAAVVDHQPTGEVTLASTDQASVESSKDYAIVGRFHSDITDGMVVVVAGLGIPGTTSAGQYLTSAAKMNEILARAPRGWAGLNFEAVLRIDVVQGSSGHVDVIASHFW